MALQEMDRRTSNDEFRRAKELQAVVTADGTLKVVNEAWNRTLGYRSDELVGHHLSALLDDGDRVKALRLINPRLVDREVAGIEISLRCKDRSYRVFEWERRRVGAEDAVFISGTDITTRKMLETTDNLRLHALMAQASKLKPPRQP